LKKIFVVFIFLLLSANLYANENNLINLIKKNYNSGDYYSTITEVMRYQLLYPKGKFYADTLLYQGLSYYKGRNYGMAINTFTSCYGQFDKTFAGEKALFYLGYVRLLDGSPFFAVKTFQEYGYLFPKGKFSEMAALGMCYSFALTDNPALSLQYIYAYRKIFPKSKHLPKLDLLEKSVVAEINRPKKNIWVAFFGSMFLPGFGHFYTGHIARGIFSFLSNAIFISLLANAIIVKDYYQVVIFSLVEATFYQYSLFSSIREVKEYNSKERYYKGVRLSIDFAF